jgi:regulator of RNase E activity RraA
MSNSVNGSAFLALARSSTAAVCNAVEAYKVRLRNEGYIDSSIRFRTGPTRPMLGYALTLEMRTDLPPTSGSTYLDRTDWWEKLAAGPHPKVVVIADVGATRGVGSVTGEVHAAVFQALGAVGIVTDGALRDLQALENLDMHIYGASTSPSHGYAHIVSVGQPVTIGGLKIETGDLLHGDQDGIVNVPLSIAASLPDKIEQMRAQEGDVLRLCRSSTFSVNGLRKLLASVSKTMETT